MAQTVSSLSIAATSWVLEMPQAAVVRVLSDGSLPPDVFFRRKKRLYVQREALQLACLKFCSLQKERLSLPFRRILFQKMTKNKTTRWKDEILTVDLTLLRDCIEDRLHRLQVAEDSIVTRPEVLGGQPCLKGTRMPAYMVAAMKHAGVSTEEIVKSYPSLTPMLIDNACLFAAAYQKRGRSVEPSWRKSRPALKILVSKKRTTVRK